MNRFGKIITCGVPSIMISRALLVAIGGLHPRGIIRQPLLGGAEPAHRRVALAELGPQVDLGMAVAVVARHRGRRAAIELADRAVGDAEDRGMHERRVIAVAFVFQDELPVGLDAMLEEAGGDLDLAFGRERAPADRWSRRRRRDALPASGLRPRTSRTRSRDRIARASPGRARAWTCPGLHSRRERRSRPAGRHWRRSRSGTGM